jgi:hypothetical protein
MANGGANISRGMGRGAAQVYDTSGPVNMYAKLMQQQQLKRAAEQKALTDELGKVTPEGLRQPDVKGFIDQYGRWRDKAIEADAERNPTRKAILKQEAEREKLTTLMYKDDSKNELRNERDRNKMLLDPNVRDRYDDVVIERVLKSSSLAKDDPNYVRDMNQFQIRPDLSKLNKDLDDLDKNILQSSEWSAPITEAAKQGNIDGVYVYNKRTIDPKKQATAYASLFDLDRKFQAGLREMFPDLAGLPKEQLKAQGIPLLVQQRVREESSKPDFRPNKDLTMQNLALRRERRLAAKDKDDVSISDIKVGPKTFTGTKLALFDKNTGKPIMDASGKKQLFTGKGVSAEFPVYSTVNPTAFKIPQNSSLYDIKRGVNKPIPEGISAALTGIGYAIVQGGGNELRATITTDEGDELMVKLADLPPDVRNDKFYKTTLQAVEDEYKRLQQSKPTTKPAKELIGETVRIQLPTGEIGEVPKDKSAAFLKKYPKAKIIK